MLGRICIHQGQWLRGARGGNNGGRVVRGGGELKHWGRKDLKYELQPLPEALPSGFRPPLGVKTNMPFNVRRTEQQQLPVYTDYRNGRSRKRTIIRKIEGDVSELSQELSALLGGSEVFHFNGLANTGDRSCRGQGFPCSED